jgi:hypothetical protein
MKASQEKFKVPKEKFRQWAEDHARKKAFEIGKAHRLDSLQLGGIQILFEHAIYCGMELVEIFRQEGHDTSEARNLRDESPS